MTINRRKFLLQSAQASIVFSIVPRFVLGGKGFTPPSEKITLGFIGVGKQGRGLVKGFAKKAQVVAAADVDQIDQQDVELCQVRRARCERISILAVEAHDRDATRGTVVDGDRHLGLYQAVERLSRALPTLSAVLGGCAVAAALVVFAAYALS